MMLIAETYVFNVVNVLPKILLAVTNTDVAETFAEQDIFLKLNCGFKKLEFIFLGLNETNFLPKIN
jgi:hypothetical protein